MIDQVIDVLAPMVAMPTESLGTNIDLIDFYADRAAEAGGAVEVVPGETGANPRSNLYVRFGPECDGGLFLSGHTDVVPAGEGWATDPYRLTEIDARLCGRGTADMKGFLAAALVVMGTVDVDRLARPVHLGLSYDEEVGCVGVRPLLSSLASGERCQPDLVVVGEPTRLELCTAHSGKRVFRVEIEAPSGHSSRSPLQPTAIEAGAEIVTVVSSLNSASRDAGGGFSTNVGTIGGGVAVNVLAPTCELDFECRHQVAHHPDRLLEPVFATIANWTERLEAIGGSITLTQTVSYPALATSIDQAPVERLRSALDDPPLGQVDFGCEAGLYAEALNTPAVIYGPGDISVAHRPDEFVPIQDLETTVDRLGATIKRFCLTGQEAQGAAQ